MLLLNGEHVTGTKERCNDLTMKYTCVEWPREWRVSQHPLITFSLAYNRNPVPPYFARARVLYSHERV